MRKVNFDEEELFALAVLEPDTRANTVSRMQSLLPELKEDLDMHGLVFSAMEKLKLLTEQEYDALPLSSYREELEYLDDEYETEDEKGEPAE